MVAGASPFPVQRCRAISVVTTLCTLATASLLGQTPDPRGPTVPECPGLPAARQGIVFGLVEDEITRVPLPGATVLAEWGSTPFDARGNPAGGEERRASTLTDPVGRFTLCGLPIETALSILAIVGDYESRSEQVVLDTEGSRELILDVAMSESATGRVVGRLVDRATHRPVTGAALHLLPLAEEERSGRRAISDGQGFFALSDIYPGSYVLQIEHIGYEPVVEPVTVPARRTVELSAQMSADPVEVEPIVVTAVRNRYLENKGFYERRDWGERLGMGVFFTRVDIERRNPLRIGHLLLTVPGVRCRGGTRSGGLRGCQFEMTRAPFCSHAYVYVDGISIIRPRPPGITGAPPATLDELVLPVEVEAVEVYTSPAQMPPEFAGMDSRCGAIAIWTRRGG